MKFYCILLMYVLLAGSAFSQDIMPAEYKKYKKAELSHKYTTYTLRSSNNIPSMRIPVELIMELKSPAGSFLSQVQALLAEAKLDYEAQRPVKLGDTYYCIEQIKGLDPYWEHTFLTLEANFYKDYEKERARREAEELKKYSEQAKIRQQHLEDSMRLVRDWDNKIAQEREREREKQMLSKRDSVVRAQREIGYHFVNATSIPLRAEPHPNSEHIVSLRACTYVKILEFDKGTGYHFVQVSEYTGYVLGQYLVESLDKVTVKGADVKFAKDNFYVAIFVPTGSTYDPMHPNGTKPPKAIHHSNNNTHQASTHHNTSTNTTNNNSQTIPFSWTKTSNDTTSSKTTTTVPANTTTAKAHINPSYTSDAPPPVKGNSKLKQCTALRVDGTPCTNMTTSSSHKCYLHE